MSQLPPQTSSRNISPRSSLLTRHQGARMGQNNLECPGQGQLQRAPSGGAGPAAVPVLLSLGSRLCRDLPEFVTLGQIHRLM